MANHHSKHKSIHYYMRVLHRDIGFLMIGIIVIYSISGVVLTLRDTDYFKTEKQIEQQLEPNLKPSEVRQALGIRRFNVQNETSENIIFSSGTYNKETGLTIYTISELPFILEKFNALHKSSSNSITGIFSVIVGTLLLFLAVSSLWMFKTCSQHFKRGMMFTGAGIVISVILLMV